MFLQVFCHDLRHFIIDAKDVISTGRGVDKNPKTGSYSVGNLGVIELKADKAKELIKLYPKNFEGWGKDAEITPKRKVVKAKQNSRMSTADL